MQKNQIKVGGVYEAKVDGVHVHVKVTFMNDKYGQLYNVKVVQAPAGSNLLGKTRQWGSAAKFRAEVKPKPVKTKPKLKMNLTGTGKKKPEGEKRPDPIHSLKKSEKNSPAVNTTGKAKVGALAVGGASSGSPSPSKCLGYTPSLVTGRCRCAVCKTKPYEERTTRPFDSAPDAERTTQSPRTVNTQPCAPSSSPGVTASPPTRVEPNSNEENTPWTGTGSYDDPAPVKRSVLGGLANAPLTTDQFPHVIVEARAGTGKTTTMIEGLKVMLGFGTHITPSPEQKAVWEALEMSKGHAKTICMVAFNRSIAGELKRRVPPGVDAMTMHGMGFKAVARAFRLWGGNRSVNNGSDYSDYRLDRILEELLRVPDVRNLKADGQAMVRAVKELVKLCKVNLFGYVWGDSVRKREFRPDQIDTDDLNLLVDTFDIEMDGTSRDIVYPMVSRVLRRCLNVEQDRYIDYDDMVWLPVVLGLAVQRYDLLLVDEAQDLNRCQQALTKMAGERLLFCGDPKQAIYGFAGADCESMYRLENELSATDRGCVVLPLTVTRRCGKAIVAEANKIVTPFSAHEDNPVGIVGRAAFDPQSKSEYRQTCQPGDMVLCRVNAPLVSECFRFVKAGKKANIQGRDIGRGLVRTVEKMRADTVGELIEKLQLWHDSEIDKENRKKFPVESKIIAVQDKLDCLMAFIDGVDVTASPTGVVQKIDAVFTDDKDAPGIRLSSIHKAKGLEARRVFLLEPEGATVPHPMARTAQAVEQEWNLRYVAITRAIEELVYVS